MATAVGHENAAGSSPLPAALRDLELKRVSQCEFHHAWPCERIRVRTETSGCVDSWERIRRVEPDRVRNVEYFPAKGQALPFREIPGFSQGHVDPEITGPAEVVSITCFARERESPGVVDEVG